ncbi:MAG TPA: TIGR02266 family protein [Myxococcales bacterium]
MFDFKSTPSRPKNAKRDDAASLANEEASVGALEAKVSGRLAELSRREEETLRKLEGKRQDLMGFAHSRAGGLAAEILGREAIRFSPGGAAVPESARAVAARRAAIEARLAAAEAEQRQAERREEALAAAEMAIVKLEKGLEQVRARATALEEAERAAKPATPVPPPAPVAAAAKPAPKPDDRRRVQRVAMTTDVSLSSESNFYSGFSSDLSDGGLFIATCNVLDCGTEVDLTFTLPTGQAVSAHGLVRWTREYNDATPEVFPGVGIEFVRMSEEHQKAVHAFVAQREPLFWVA